TIPCQAERSLTFGSRRLGRRLDLTGFIVRFSSMPRMLALGLIVEFGDGHMLEPIAFLTFRAVHRRVPGRWSIGPVKMVKACLAAIGLGFDTECTFDSLTDEQQFCRGIAYGLIEHQELDPAVAFIQPHMVGWVRLNRYKRIRFKDG